MDAEKWKDTILAKSNEENQPLVDRYIDMIDSIEQENRQLKAKLTPAEASEVEHASVDVEADMADVMADPVQEEAAPAEDAAETAGEAGAKKFCPQCGAEVTADALFCTKCGAQL